MSQAQALLDCVADLVAHCGVPGAVAVLQEGLQLRWGASWAPGHHSPDSWRILGQSPSPDGPGNSISAPVLRLSNCRPSVESPQYGVCTAGAVQLAVSFSNQHCRGVHCPDGSCLSGGVCCAVAWECPPADEAGASPRPKGDSVYVSREPLGKHSPSSTDAESPLTRLKSRLGTFSQPIPEGSSGSSAISPDSNAGEGAAQARGSLPNGVSGQHEQGSLQDGHVPDASSESGAPGELKQTSALSAALSDGLKPVSSQNSDGSQAGDRLSAASSAGGSDASSFQELAEEKHGHSAPRSIPGSGRQAGRAHAPRAAQRSSPSGVSSATGTALFWTGSQALGISFADDAGSAESLENYVGDHAPAALAAGDGQDLSCSPLEAKAKVYRMAFEGAASPEPEDDCGPEHDGINNISPGTSPMNGLQHVNDGKHMGVLHNSLKGPPAEEAVVESTGEDARQQSVGDIAAAAVAEVDAESPQQDAKGSQKAQPASSMSGELPPGEQLSEQGSVDEERDALGVSPVRLAMQLYIFVLCTGPTLHDEQALWTD